MLAHKLIHKLWINQKTQCWQWFVTVSSNFFDTRLRVAVPTTKVSFEMSTTSRCDRLVRRIIPFWVGVVGCQATPPSFTRLVAT